MMIWENGASSDWLCLDETAFFTVLHKALQALYMLLQICPSVSPAVCQTHISVVSERGMQRVAVLPSDSSVPLVF